MNPKKEKACHHNDRLGKTVLISDMLLDSARIIVNSTDSVKLITAQIQYCRLVEKMYRNHRRMK